MCRSVGEEAVQEVLRSTFDPEDYCVSIFFSSKPNSEWINIYYNEEEKYKNDDFITFEYNGKIFEVPFDFVDSVRWEESDVEVHWLYELPEMDTEHIQECVENLDNGSYDLSPYRIAYYKAMFEAELNQRNSNPKPQYEILEFSFNGECYEVEVIGDETWTTVRGEKVLISSMTDAHLQNTVNMLKRNPRENHMKAYFIALLNHECNKRKVNECGL